MQTIVYTMCIYASILGKPLLHFLQHSRKIACIFNCITTLRHSKQNIFPRISPHFLLCTYMRTFRYAFRVHWLSPSSPTCLWASITSFMKASLLAFIAIPQSGQAKPTPPEPAVHLPVFQPGQRWSSGTPARALSICIPHPAQVNFYIRDQYRCEEVGQLWWLAWKDSQGG